MATTLPAFRPLCMLDCTPFPGLPEFTMHRLSLALALALSTSAFAADPSDKPVDDTAPFRCQSCDGWNKPHAPFRLGPNSYYVGTDGLSAVLIDSGDGLVLLDGGLPQSAEVIVANIRTLGFDIGDVKFIGISHPHFDHVGGVAALARLSGATVIATERGAQSLRGGDTPRDDAQYADDNPMDFPPLRDVRVFADGEVLRLGHAALTLHATPGHAPGGSTWSWRDCDKDGAKCLDLVYADSLNPVSADGFRFSADAARVPEFRRSMERIRTLPCDVMVSAHPSQSGLFEREANGTLVDTTACKAYADAAEAKLDARLATEGEATR